MAMAAGAVAGNTPSNRKITSQKNRIEIPIRLSSEMHVNLSCGMNPVLALEIKDRIGTNWLANVGGWLHTGESIYEKVYEMRKALDG